MNTDKHIDIDLEQAAYMMSFLIGKTVIFRDSHNSICTTTVNSIVIDPKEDGSSVVNVYSGLGVQHIVTIEKFRDIWLVEEDGLKCVYNLLENRGVYF